MVCLVVKSKHRKHICYNKIRYECLNIRVPLSAQNLPFNIHGCIYMNLRARSSMLHTILLMVNIMGIWIVQLIVVKVFLSLKTNPRKTTMIRGLKED